MSKDKVRLSVDCTPEERMYIKMLATRSNETISEYLLSFVRKKMPGCFRAHEPNDETVRALRESPEEEGEVYDSVESFWESMGISPDAED
ncbi:MAG: hypothetical protein ChlgKO_13460 [Chlamydiales bacterium]